MVFQGVKNVDGHFVSARGNEGVDSDSVILLEVFFCDCSVEISFRSRMAKIF